MTGQSIDYSVLPTYREVLPDLELEFYEELYAKGRTERDEYRCILALKRIDWDKYFAKQNEVHDLVRLAANSIPNNPVGFLKPELVNRALQIYEPNCPRILIQHAEAFREAVNRKDLLAMREIYDLIHTLIIYS